MILTKLNELFDVSYGSKLDLNKMKPVLPSQGGINFVGRSSQNHGVSGTVARIPERLPYEVGLITVALGGTKLLCAFVQEQPFYTAQNVAVLRPKLAMTFGAKVYVCLCIRHNRFRYSAFGREANRTLRELEIPAPSEFPHWINGVAMETVDSKSASKSARPTPPLDTSTWKEFRYTDLFEVKKGRRIIKSNLRPGPVPFITAIDNNNGLREHFIGPAIFDPNTITVPYNGNGVGEAFYQSSGYWACDDVNVLCPKFPLTPAVGMFLAALIRKEKYRFSYGRKWHKERMEASTIRLPVDKRGKPDWDMIECYINTLPFTSQLI